MVKIYFDFDFFCLTTINSVPAKTHINTKPNDPDPCSNTYRQKNTNSLPSRKVPIIFKVFILFYISDYEELIGDLIKFRLSF